MRELVKVGAFVFALETTPQAAAESVGEYVRDGIDAGLNLNAVYDAARVAARYAAQVTICPTCGRTVSGGPPLGCTSLACSECGGVD